ncbi:hypothetical protein PMAYCL1PPCAC_19351, partial [Pristionchus mayeri]
MGWMELLEEEWVQPSIEGRHSATGCLQDRALALLLFLLLQCRLRRLLEHLADTLLVLGGALQIGECSDLLCDGSSLLGFHRLLLHLLQLTDRLGVVAEILLVADQDDGDIRAEVTHLGRPLLGDILERVGRVDGEAHEDHVRVGVRERSQSVVVFLPRSIPQRQLHLLSIDLDVCDVVLEDSGDVPVRELVLGEDDEQTRLTARSVANDHQLLSYSGHFVEITQVWKLTSRWEKDCNFE